MSCSQDDLQSWILLSLAKGEEMEAYLSKATLNKGCQGVCETGYYCLVTEGIELKLIPCDLSAAREYY